MRLRYALALASLLLAAPALADTGFIANLSGAAEVPPVVTGAFGTAYCVLNTAETQLSYSVSYSNLTSDRTAAHFHGPATAVQNAGVRFGIAGTGPTSDIINGVWAISATDVGYLKNGLLYINIHSSTYAGGELRGQVLPDATPASATTWGRLKRLYR